MQLKVEGIKEHKGFLLTKPCTFDGSILVLTGRNGSGKTRLIESLQNGHSQATINSNILSRPDVKLVAQGSLNPSFGSSYNDAKFQAKVTASLQLYDRIKNDLDAPYDQDKGRHYNRSQEGGLDYESLFRMCTSISNTLKKPASELTHDEIILHFEEPLRNVLGIQNISTIFNQYIKRLEKNKYNEWLSTTKRENVQYWSDKEFLDNFGDRPWHIANRILEDTFDGKFKFSTPDEDSRSYTYQTQLIETENQLPVTVEHLSSGEKTLLWLSLTLFNSQYYDSDTALTPKLLLIDEPDALLHPKMVLKMYQSLNSFINNFNSTVVISTHSPTTVALAPADNVYLVEKNSVSTVEKDSAISELLDGVTQISLNPENRRQVFVESQYDAAVYQAIYSKIATASKMIDPKISLSFVSSGPKMPRQHLIAKARQLLGISDERKLHEFANSINGSGNCVQVIAQVESLVENQNDSVRGIIDWDLANKPSKYISILAPEYAYSIENLTLDPICILLLLHIDKQESFPMLHICGTDIHWSDWLKNRDLLQFSIDRFIENILERSSNRDSKLRYMSGLELFTDHEYLIKNGHDLEARVKEKYPSLRAYCKKGKDGELKYSIVNKSMIILTNGGFIPSAYEIVLSEVQK